MRLELYGHATGYAGIRYEDQPINSAILIHLTKNLSEGYMKTAVNDNNWGCENDTFRERKFNKNSN